jgi:hypothetical protein
MTARIARVTSFVGLIVTLATTQPAAHRPPDGKHNDQRLARLYDP